MDTMDIMGIMGIMDITDNMDSTVNTKVMCTILDTNHTMDIRNKCITMTIIITMCHIQNQNRDRR